MEKNISIDVSVKNDLLFVEYKGTLHFDSVKAKLLIDAIEKISRGKQYPAIINFSEVKYIDRETRDLFFSKIIKLLPALAFVTKNTTFHILLNSALLAFTPQLQTEIFSNTEEAQHWIKQNFFENVLI